MKKILIVEDDANISKALSIRLKSWGYQVRSAPDALSSVEVAMQFEPDLLLLDISIPAGDGFSVGERLQTLLPKQMPMIFITASRNPELRERAKEIGAAAFFQKPYDAEELRYRIELALAGIEHPAASEVYTI